MDTDPWEFTFGFQNVTLKFLEHLDNSGQVHPLAIVLIIITLADKVNTVTDHG